MKHVTHVFIIQCSVNDTRTTGELIERFTFICLDCNHNSSNIYKDMDMLLLYIYVLVLAIQLTYLD